MAVAYWYFVLSGRDKLADEYYVSKESFVIESKPHRCDFDDAPLVNKHCHCEKSIDSVKAATSRAVESPQSMFHERKTKTDTGGAVGTS